MIRNINNGETNSTFTGFPYHQRSYREKGEKYFKDCIDSGEKLALYSNNIVSSTNVRTSKKNKVININLYNDIVDKREMDKTINPLDMNISSFPGTYRNYPLLNPSINLLCGEERKRMFIPRVTAIGDGISTSKVENIKAKFDELYIQLATEGIQDEKVIEKKVNDFQKWANYSYKDMRERMGTQVLQYLYRTLDLQEEFSRGFEDLLITSEEIYFIDIIGDEPIARKGNPLHVSAYGMGESWKLEDATIIVEDAFMSIGKVIDTYYDYLTSAQIKKIERGNNFNEITGDSLFAEAQFSASPATGGVTVVDMTGLNTTERQLTTQYLSGNYDNEGNVRVLRCIWKGMRKIYVREYIDENGEEQRELLPEIYKIDKSLGETIKEYWISEWYEGTKIGADNYVKLEPCKVQMRHRDNISICYPPVVGTVYNVNSSKGRSLMDVGRDYQYLWNTFWYRLELAFTKYKGKIGKLNLHLIPDFQDVQSAIHFAETTGWMLQDKFNEGQRGIAKGKLAGGMNEGSDVIDMEMGNYIQQHIGMLQFIKQQTDELTGITPQRRGAIDNRETVGGVERSVMQSSHITEKWFSVHDNTKVRVLRALLEAAKIAWKGKSFLKEFVLDDGTKAMLEFDYETYKEAMYGVDVSNTSDDIQTLQAMRGLAERFAQVEGGMKVVAEMYRTKDMASIYRKIIDFEDAKAQQAQEQFQAEQEQAQAQIQAQQEAEMMKFEFEAEQKDLDRQLKQYEIDSNNETRLTIAEINTYIGAENMDQNENGIPDPMEIAAQGLKEREADSKYFMSQMEQQRKEKETNFKKDTEDKKANLEKKKLELEEKKLVAAQKLQQMKDKEAYKREQLKSKTAIKNKVSGQK